MIRHRSIAILLLALAPLSLRAEDTPEQPTADCSTSPYNSKLTISAITGGREQSIFRKPSLPNEDYASALKENLANAGLLSADPFAQDVIPISVSFTHETRNYTSTITSAYSLSITDADDKVIEVSTSHTGKRTDGLAGATITKKSTAKALHSNLSELVQKLCQPSP